MAAFLLLAPVACAELGPADSGGGGAGDGSGGAVTLVGSGAGLQGQYFDNFDFTAPRLTRTDPMVNFNWGAGAPDPSMGPDTFSVRWTGFVKPAFTQAYTFYTQSDDGVRLTVNGVALVNNWTNHASTENSGAIALTAGVGYSVTMEYFENGGQAVAKLLWSSASVAKQAIPTANLFLPSAASGGTGGTGGATGGSTGTGGATGGSSGTGGAMGGAGGTGGATGGAGGAASPPTLSGCQVFPSDNPWNTDVSAMPVDASSAAYIANINGNGSGQALHPDFGTSFGIPFTTVPGTQAKVPMTFDIADESDPGPYPFPPDAPIEGGASSTGDRHVLVLDRDNCVLYETWDSHLSSPGWHCGSGAIFNLRSNALRPDGFTSADAAGLPVLPGLVRYDEAVTSGAINHALRFTVHRTQRAFVHPATHFASTVTDPSAPPMGLRLRLKASFDVSGFSGAAKVVLVALKKYGMILADNGSNWFITGVPDSRFDDANLDQLKSVPGTAFEVVQVGAILH